MYTSAIFYLMYFCLLEREPPRVPRELSRLLACERPALKVSKRATELDEGEYNNITLRTPGEARIDAISFPLVSVNNIHLWKNNRRGGNKMIRSKICIQAPLYYYYFYILFFQFNSNLQSLSFKNNIKYDSVRPFNLLDYKERI